MTIALETHASAAIGVCKRRGLGNIRHLATADLWVQDRLREREFILVKIPGHDNCSDILTNYVDRQTLQRHMAHLGLRLETGRAESAPTIEHT